MNSDPHIIHLTKVIEIRGVNPYVLISKENADKVKSNWKKPMPVLVQVNGQPNPPWQINMMPVGDGNFYLYLHGDVRRISHTKVGDTVDIQISFNTLYRNGPQHPMPEWFLNALHENKKAYNNWKALTPSRQKEILRYFSLLKSEEAINRNLKKVMLVLSSDSGRFMGRRWSNGK